MAETGHGPWESYQAYLKDETSFKEEDFLKDINSNLKQRSRIHTVLRIETDK